MLTQSIPPIVICLTYFINKANKDFTACSISKNPKKINKSFEPNLAIHYKLKIEKKNKNICMWKLEINNYIHKCNDFMSDRTLVTKSNKNLTETGIITNFTT